MKQYIGTKLVEAEPQQKDGREGYRVRYAGGYESWSPKEVFETAYLALTVNEELRTEKPSILQHLIKCLGISAILLHKVSVANG